MLPVSAGGHRCTGRAGVGQRRSPGRPRRQPGERHAWPARLAQLTLAVAALLAHRPALPAGQAMAWLAGWTSVLGVSLFFYLLVLFPDGHLPSRRWRVVAWLYGSALAVGLAAAAVQPGTTVVFIGDLGPTRNPLGWQQAAAVLGMVNGAARLVTTVLLPVGAVGLGLRRSRGVARQQLKWLAYAGGVLASAILAEGLLQWLGRDSGCCSRCWAWCSSSAGCWGPGRRRGGDLALPAVRHRPAAQPHLKLGLRAAHCAAGRGRPDHGADHGVAVAATVAEAPVKELPAGVPRPRGHGHGPCCTVSAAAGW